VLIYAFQESYPKFMEDFSVVFPTFIAGAATVASSFALRRYWKDIRNRFSVIWLGLTLGMFLWFLGELSWAIYVFFLGIERPYPSFGDVAWLSGYVPLFIAIYIYVQIFRPAIPRRAFWISGLMVCSVGLAIFIFLVVPFIWTTEDMTTLAVGVAYPALDVVLFSEAILGLLIFIEGKIGKAWLLINAGILMNVIADMLFSYTTAIGTYWIVSAHPLELYFHWGYILFILAFYTHIKEL